MIRPKDPSPSISVGKRSYATSYSERSHKGLNHMASPPGLKSRSIPISSNPFHRTASEMQLYVDEQIADQRDFALFARIVDGIQQTQASGKNRQLQLENQSCLKHVIQTRSGSVASTPSLVSSIPAFEDNSVGLSIDDTNTTGSHGYISWKDHDIEDAGVGTAFSTSPEEDCMVFELEL